MSLIRKLFSQRAQLPKSDVSDWQAKSDLSFFELEQRTVFDGAMAATADGAMESAENEGMAAAGSLENGGTSTDNSVAADGLVEALGLLPDLGSQTTEIVFVDAGVENYQQIVDGILNQQDTTRVFDVVLLDSNSDGIQQISDTLAGYSQLDAVHIISHGTGASVALGNATLDANSIDEYAENISGWGTSFTETGDLLIYGCDLASISAGESLVNVLSQLTGADVSASDDLTGHESLGGDWDLEYATGAIEADIAVSSATQTEWVGVLATETVSDDFSTNDYTGDTGSQNWTGNWSEVDAGGAGPGAGSVQISGGELSLNNFGGAGGELSLTREVDLSGATSATLTFDYRTSVGVDVDDKVVLEISNDGGASWFTQQTYANVTGVSAGSGSYDISAHIANNTQIRFRIESFYGANDEFFFVDNVQISYEAGLPNNSISGTIYEDVDGDGDILDDGVGVENVEVSLYQDDGDGIIDAGDTYIGMELTDASGNFTFDAQANGTYWAVVDSHSVSPSGSLNAQFSVGDSWAEQSYGSVDAVTFDGSFNYQASDGILFGGMTADISDDASNLTSAQHVNRVVLSGSAATGVDYGFSYNVITNTGDSTPVDPFTDVNAWESFDPSSNGVGTDPVRGYGGSVYDGRYIYHVPSGGDSNSHGEVLRYDTQGEYGVASSWTAFDPSSNGVGTDAEGYDGAVFDGRYIYFTPIHDGGGYHGEVLRFDTQGDFETAGSWSTFDPGASGVGIDPDGYREARFDGRYIYFSPHFNGTSYHSEVLRYDTLGTFDNTASWSTFDPVTAGVASQSSYDGIEFDGRYMYFVPLYDGTNYHGEIVRYDTQASFNLASSWEAFDPGANGVGVDPDGYNGAVFDGQYVYFVPYRADLAPVNTWTGEVLRYDTQATFGSAAAWETFDPGAAGVGLTAEGFIEAVFDGHYIYFMPDQQDGGGDNGELLRYDVQGAFNSTSSWTAFNPDTNGIGTNPLSYRGGVVVDQYIYFSPVDTTKEALRFDFTYQSDGQGSLRQFIENSNSISGVQSSQFVIAADDNNHFYYADDGTVGQVSLANISTTTLTLDSGIAGIDPDYASSWYRIQPVTALPDITDTIVLDGYTQAGAQANTLAVGNDAILKIEIDGSVAGAGANGLILSASDSNDIRGLIINNFQVDGILINASSSNNTISGNFIGTDASGTILRQNIDDGIDLFSDGNIIGGSTAGARNLISGNQNNGIELSGAAATNNILQGNYIGTNRSGTLDLGNGDHGIEIASANNTIGGTTALTRNIISGNDRDGIRIASASAIGNIVQGNYIGVNATGTAAIANTLVGITIQAGATGNIIGGNVAGARNVISGNNSHGVRITGVGTDNNNVQGNYIGLNAAGNAAIINASDGVQVENGATNTTIGGNVAGAGNVISGNDLGIDVTDTAGTGTVISGNIIGLDATGTIVIGNSVGGIDVDANNTTIGGTTIFERNIISGNSPHGVVVGFGAAVSNVQILGNYIGTDITGTIDRGNTSAGIVLSAGAVNATVDGNLISGNDWVGLYLDATNNNTIIRNLIGTEVTGSTALANGSHGVFVTNGSANNAIGSTATGEGNTIAFNDRHGVTVDATAGIGNLIRKNSIHSNANLGIDLIGGNVTANDGLDSDTGGNNVQNFPVLASAASTGGNTTINGAFQSNPGTTFEIDFYSSALADPLGYGEGEVYLGSATVITDGSGLATISSTLVGVSVTSGHFITATATHSDGSTSEFAQNVVVSSNILTVDTTSDVSDGDTSSIAALLGDRGADGFISLREAIIATNNTTNIAGNPDEIHFEITAPLVGGAHTIAVGAGGLPSITDAVIIDGTTESDFAANGNKPVVVLDGNNPPSDGIHLTSTAGGSTIRGLVISDFGSNAIQIDAGSDNNTIVGNYLGQLTTAGLDAGASEAIGAAVIYVQGANNTIGGLTAADRNVISGGDNGVYFDGATASGNIVIGNYIGTDATGNTVIGNNFDGVYITNGATGNIIGGGTAAHRNVISGNGEDGINIVGETSDNNVIQGNYIGVSADGTSNLTPGSNVGDGINVYSGADNTIIGGSISGEGNWIAGSRYIGVEIDGFSTGTIIQGNRIGTDATGTLNWGTGENSILLENGVSNSLVGGTTASAGNISTFAGLISATFNDGISVVNGGAGNTIIGNSIYSNVGLGIDLGTNGVTANDADDSDVGANNLQNFPVISQAALSGTDLTLSGTLDTDGLTTQYRLEFFGNVSGTQDATNGEGRTYLGTTTVTTNGSGDATFSNLVLSGITLSAGDFVTATATKIDNVAQVGIDDALAYGDTSEFADNLIITTTTNTLVVDTTSDTADGDTSSINALIGNKGADGFISLREAIIATNNTANFDASTPDEIHFEITAPLIGGAHTIAVGAGGLPDITGAVIIDGTTDADFAGTPIIVLDGTSAGAIENGLQLNAGSDGSTIRGLVINNFTNDGIYINNSDGNTIVGNYIGTDVTGTIDRGNGRLGILIDNGSSGNTIGGVTIADRNIISGNDQTGIHLEDIGTSGNIITGNYIGVDVTGAIALGNTQDGIKIFIGADNTTIGGTLAGAGNVIGGNGQFGIFLQGLGVDNSTIQGNFIGTDTSGSINLGNSTGIFIDGAASGNLIGGAVAAAGNIIANSLSDGVNFSAGSGANNAIIGNSIYSNFGLAIDLGVNGVNINDAEDADAGPNGLLNYPVLTNVVQNGANLDIDFDVDLPAGNYRIEFFDNSSGLDASGFGEGETFVGFANITVTGAAGYETFSTTLVGVTASAITNITTTATQADGTFTNFSSTSEFGPQFIGTGVLEVDTTSDVSDGNTSSIAALLGDRGADGFISLREAIEATNNTTNIAGNPDEIRFDIAANDARHFYYADDGLAGQITLGNISTTTQAFDAGIVGIDPDFAKSWYSIQLSGALDGLTDSVIIDATSQSGFINSPIVELDGNGGSYDGFDITASNSTVKGFAINNFAGTGIWLNGAAATNNTIQTNYIGLDVSGTIQITNTQAGIGITAGANANLIGGAGANEGNIISGNSAEGIGVWDLGSDNNVIQGNYIGTNSAGVIAIGNGTDGIIIGNGAANNTIGGTGAGEGNVISGNSARGVYLRDAGTDFNIIQGNYIGVDVTGTVALGNVSDGIKLWNGAANNVIGGTSAGAANIIGGNGQYGIFLEGAGTDNNIIQGNFIGTDVGGTINLGNLRGVELAGGVNGNLIGGTAAGAGNTIAFSVADGITLNSSTGTGNSILGNTIYSNADLGIDLDDDGVTANDLNDADGGANNLQNFPIITQAVIAGANLSLSGTLNTDAGVAQYRLEFFGNVAGTQDATNGEGRTYLGTTTVAIDIFGNATFTNIVLSGVALGAGDFVTATATAIDAPAQVGIDDALAYGDTSEFAANFAITGSSPTANNDGVFVVNEGSTTNFDLTANDTDPDDGLDLTSIVIISGPANGSIVVNIDGTIDYIHDGSETFSDSFTYTIDDNGGLSSNVATVNITVSPLNDAPHYDGGGGRVASDIGPGDDAGYASVIQPDGKILIAGYSDNGTDDDFAITRYNIDGSLDITFGGGDGIVITDIGGGIDQALALELQSDGKIIAAGVSHNGVDYDFAVTRYNVDGSIDTTFGGGDGIVTTAVRTGGDHIFGLGIQSDGSIVVGGYSNGPTYDFALVRYTSAGVLDATFGTAGIAITDVSGGSDYGYDLAIQSDDKIVLTGISFNGVNYASALLRYDANGVLDITFGGGDGIVTTTFGASGDWARSVTIQTDGKILVGGFSDGNFALIRYNTDGSLDLGFGGGSGIVTTDLGSASDTGSSVIVQADGKILIAGYTLVGADNDFALVRYNSDGSLDLGFGGGDGISITDLNSGEDYGESVSVQADGKIIVAGRSSDGGGGNIRFGLVRYNSDGSLDSGFNPFNTLNGTPTFVEGGAAVILDSDVEVSDAELDALNGGLGDYHGSSLTLLRNGGANAEDILTFVDGNGITLIGGNTLEKSGAVIATFDVTTTSGELVITFTNANGQTPTSADVDNILRQITYANSSDTPPASVQIDWTFDDGNTGSQGAGGALQVIGNTVVSITPTNDAPVISLASGAVTFVEDGPPVLFDPAVILTDSDSSDFDGGTLTASIPSNASIDDRIAIRNQGTSPGEIGISGSNVTYGGVIIGIYSGGTDGITPLVINFNANANVIAVQALASNITFFNVSDIPSTANRIVRIVVTDGDGGTSNNGQNLISVTAVNDAPTFDIGDGIVTTDINAGSDNGRSVAVQSDGKILVAGYSYNGVSFEFLLTRYNADGSLDSSFDSDGIVTTELGTGTDAGYSLTIQDDGKILVAGQNIGVGITQLALIRYNTDGSLDLSFDTDGIVTTDINGGAEIGYDVDVQSDGKILVAGVSLSTSNEFLLVRYNTDGSLDTSFDSDGIVTTDISPASDIGRGVTIQSDGKILVTGISNNGISDEFTLVRYNSNGSLDTSFDFDGIVTTNVFAGSDSGYDVTLQPDGEILVAGTGYNGTSYEFVVVHYNADGSLDAGFGTGGIVTTDIGPNNDIGYSIKLQSDGKLLVAGYSHNGISNEFALVRYNDDGSLDLSFNTTGIVTTDISTGSDVGQSVFIQSDGKIVVAGTSSNATEIAVVRYNSDGSLDTSFDLNTTLDNTSTFIEDGAAVVLDADVDVSDSELDSLNGGLGDYSGASLTLVRNSGSNAEDVLTFVDGNGITLVGGTVLQKAGATIATFNTTSTPGELVITFTNANGQTPTSVDVDNILRQITYANSSDTPPASVQIDWTFDDGNTGSQGLGGALNVIGSTTVTITATNDAPVNTVPGTQTITEEVQTAISGISVADVDAAASNITTRLQVTDGILDVTLSGAATISAGINGSNDLTIQGDITDVNATLAALFYTGNTGVNGIAADTLTITTDDGGNTGMGGALQDIDNIQIDLTAVNNAPTFVVGDGIVTTDIGSNSNAGYTSILQPDGKILLVGDTNNGFDTDFTILRYNADGSLDTSFGGGDGIVLTDFGGTNERGRSVALQADGKIVVAGYVYNGTDNDFAIVRYNSDGSLDTSFGGGDGIFTHNLAADSDELQAVSIQSDGKIVASGSTAGGGSSDFAVIRLNSDGTLDTSFDSDGVVITAIGATLDYSYDQVIQPDGKIVIAGRSHNGTDYDSVLVRYNVDGSLDAAFGIGGIVTTDAGVGDDYLRGVTLQSDGKFVVTGLSHNGTDYDILLMRYNSNGTLDLSFGGGDGIVTVAAGAGQDIGYKTTIQPDDKILVAGRSFNGTNVEFIVLRFNSDGSVDTSFGGGDGNVTTAVGTAGDTANSISLQSDGKIILSGFTYVGASSDIALVRYNADGTLDTSFDTGLLNGTSTFIENGSAVVLDIDVDVSDTELDALNGGLGDYHGSSLTLVRNGGVNAEDVLTFVDGNGITLVGGNALEKSGAVIATFDVATTSGELVITFTNANGQTPTSSDIDNILRQITYANSSDTPPASVQIDWTFDDGNTGSQGTGGALQAIGNTVVTITPTNDVPVATGNTVIATEDLPLVIGAGDFNFSDGEGDALQSVTISGLNLNSGTLTHTGGTVTVINGMTVSLAQLVDLTFTSALNDSTNSSFLYTVNDSGAGVATGVMDITVNAVNDVPVATGNTVVASEDMPLVIGAGDFSFSDVEGDALQSVTITGLNLNGGTLTHTGGTVTVINGMTVTLAQLTDLTFTSALNDSTNSSFTYVVNDADIGVVSSVMNITVNAVNDVPVATGNTVITNEDQSLVIGAGDFNFSDIEGDALQSVTITGLNLNGGTLTHSVGAVTVTDGMIVTLAQLADLTFTSALNDSTNSSFIYTVNDAGSGVSSGVMNITVNAINDVPVATGNTVVTNEDQPLLIGAGDFSFTDVEGDGLVSVTISGLNLNGGTLAHTGGTVPVTNGTTVTLAQLADLTFSPALNSTINSSFTYTVNDAGSGVVSAVMNITVNAVNDVPVATGNTVITNEDQPLIIGPGDFSFTDTEGNGLVSVTISGLNLNGGTLTHTGGTVNVVNGMTVTAAQLADLTFTSALNNNNDPSFTYTVNDSGLGLVSATLDITVNPVNDAPVNLIDASTLFYSAATGAIPIDPVLTITDVDSPTLTSATIWIATGHIAAEDRIRFTDQLGITGSFDGSTGIMTLTGTASVADYQTALRSVGYEDVIFTPTQGTLTVNFTVSDGSLTSIVDTRVITVVPNAPPNAVDDFAVVNEGSTVIINVAGNDSDSEGVLDLNSIVIVSPAANGSLVVNGDGTVTYSHNGSETLSDTFTYTIEDQPNFLSNVATVTITVNPVNDNTITPVVDVDGGVNAVDENAVVGTSVGITAFADDIDSTDSVAYTLDDNDGGRFAIDVNSGVVTVAGAIDRETDGAVRNIIVRATSSDSTFSTSGFVIAINDVDEFDVGTVSDINGAINAVNENAVVGTIVGLTANAVDGDATNSIVTYTLTNNDGGRFAIDLNSGVVTVAGAIDREADGPSRNITVRATSVDGSFSDQLFAIVINDVDEFDVGVVSDVDGTLNAVDENSVIGTVVGVTANGVDGDATNSIVTYTLTNNDGGRFGIDINTGLVTVAGAIDREADGPTRNITVRATSTDGSFTDQIFAIGINDVDEFNVGVVSDVNAALNEVDENATLGTIVGITANATDVDATNNTITYTLANNDGGRFAIDLNSGVVTVAGAIDREADGPSRNITVRATSTDGSFSDQLFAITINDLDEFDVGPVGDADVAADAVDENSAIGTVVGLTANAIDGDATNSTVTYTLTNNDGGRFTIDLNSGVVTVAGAIDREADGPSRNITVRATSTDGSFSDQVFAIAINDVDEFNVTPVVDLDGALEAVDENSVIGTTVGITANAFDADATTNTITYTLTNNDGGRFAIDINSGVVTVAGAIDREADGPSRNITVRASSSDGSFSDLIFAIAINDLDEFDVGPVSDADIAADAVDENSAIGTVVGITANAIDGDATNSTITYVLTNNDGGRFAIDINSGVVTVAGAIDREADGPSRNITVRANSTDGSFTDQVFAIAINDLDEFNVSPVVDVDGALDAVDENSAVGTAVGITANAFDADATTNAITYTLTNNDGGRFAIDINTGVVTVAGAIDREADGPSRNISVRATSTDGSFSDQIFAIAINDLDEFDVGAVSDTDATLDAVDENSAIGTFVGITANAVDADATNSTISYTLTNNDGGRFAIDINSGVVTVAGVVDREADGPVRNITVRASSTDGSFTDQVFVIAINDLDEFDVSPVVDVDGAVDALDENSVIGTVVGITANAFDGDATNNTITYLLTNNDGGRFAIDINSGVVTLAGTVDREADGASRNITVRASSTDGSFSDQIFAIAINDLDEFDVGVVSDVNATLDAVDENSAIGTVVGITANAVDADATNSTISYTLTNNDGGRFAVDVNSGVVTVAGAIDREADGPSRNITLRAMSLDGSFTDQIYTIVINDVDEFDVSPVVDVDATVTAIDENSTVGTLVGLTASAFDGDATNNTITYSLADNDGGRFAIDINSGVVTLAGAVDREADGASRNITVRASSSDGSFTDQVFGIAINDLDEFDVGPISDIDVLADQVDENSFVGAVVGLTANAVDGDATNSTISYTLIDDDGGRFAIDINTGVVSVGGPIDYEADGSSRNIIVRATSSDGSFSDQGYSITINDVNDTSIISPPGGGGGGGGGGPTDPIIPPTVDPDLPLNPDEPDGPNEPEIVVDPDVDPVDPTGGELPFPSRPNAGPSVFEPVQKGQGTLGAPVIDKSDTLRSGPLNLTHAGLGLVSLNSDAFWSAIDDARSGITGDNDDWQSTFEKLTVGGSVALTAGYVSWLLRGGVLVTAMMSSLSVWQTYDPLLVVLGRKREDKDKGLTKADRLFDEADEDDLILSRKIA